MDTEKLIKELGLEPHKEGGYFRKWWQSPRQDQGRPYASHIYYLLPKGERCQWHKLSADELWLFHQGATLTFLWGGSGDKPSLEKTQILGGESFHLLVPAGTWQSAIAEKGDVLVSCVVSPGYREEDCILYEGDLK